MIMGHCSCCAHTNECAPEKHIEKKESIFAEYWKVGLSFILLISGIIMNALELPFFREGYFSLIWYIVAYLPVGLPVMKEAWESIKDKDYFSEFTLMFVATLGAFYIGEYPEGVAVMLFYSVGELFQEKAVDKAKRNIGALLDVRPEEAAVVRDGRVIIENPQNVKVGETIEIKTGGRVPLDGMMLNEVAAFNTAALTGESVPRSIRMGEEVLAGMIVTDKVIRIKVIRPFDKSALARILELVQNAISGGHKILIFSQFTTMLDGIAERLNQENIPYYVLKGSTPKQERMQLVTAFNQDETPVFLISLKAGGTGLNLTAADIVIHYDPWWNTAVQNQATDRAHRIGQKNKVLVYRLIAQNTIEEKILRLQEKKAQLADQILGGETTKNPAFSREELLALLQD